VRLAVCARITEQPRHPDGRAFVQKDLNKNLRTCSLSGSRAHSPETRGATITLINFLVASHGRAQPGDSPACLKDESAMDGNPRSTSLPWSTNR
jgi:hypothetical protein